MSSEHSLPEPTIRIGKLGRKLHVELDYLVADGREVGESDLIRRELMQRLSEPARILWINVELHRPGLGPYITRGI